jgi:hypothetical protein
MVFDFYGPDVSPQDEIADAARTDVAYGGTYGDDMRRAAHFSDLSTSVGNEMPGSVTGYTARGLGYGAFEHYFSGIDALKPLIDTGYPITVLTAGDQASADDPSDEDSWGHFRVVIGYDDALSEITMQDPLFGAGYTLSYTVFEDWWYSWSVRWGLFTQPWIVDTNAIIVDTLNPGEQFTVTTTVTYPCPSPFSTSDYPASTSQATIQLPAGLSLPAFETATKTLGTGTLTAGGSETVQWTVNADVAGVGYAISVEAEGQVSGSVSTHDANPGYSYDDRIGGADSVSVTVTDGVGVGTLQGTVTDADTGLPIMGATVSADGYSTTTDASGFYSFPSIPEGSYDVTAEMTGYVSETASGVTVTADTTTTQDFALSPLPAVPSIESSDSTGAKKDTFALIDDVYTTGDGYQASTTYDVYLVKDVMWIDGMAIPPPVPGTTSTLTADASGNIPPTLLWSNPLVPGKYDIVVDVDGDGLYYAESDALDDNDIEVTAGFFVIPELPLGTVLASLSMFVALIGYVSFKRHRTK